ncbi:MAG: YggT family protein [Candidatus Dasytiphilus stammeri]
MLIVSVIIKNILDLYIIMLLFRCWMILVLEDDYNPLVKLIIKITQPLLNPLQYFVPLSYQTLEINSIVIAFFLTIIKYLTMSFLLGNKYEFISMNIFMIGIISLIKIAGSLVLWIILVQRIIKLLNQGYHPLAHIFTKLTEPILSPIRNHIPPIGCIDLSPFMVVLLIYFLNDLGLNIFPKLWPVL